MKVEGGKEGGFDVEKGCSCCYKLSKTKKNFDEGRTRKSRRQSLRTRVME